MVRAARAPAAPQRTWRRSPGPSTPARPARAAFLARLPGPAPRTVTRQAPSSAAPAQPARQPRPLPPRPQGRLLLTQSKATSPKAQPPFVCQVLTEGKWTEQMAPFFTTEPGSVTGQWTRPILRRLWCLGHRGEQGGLGPCSGEASRWSTKPELAAAKRVLRRANSSVQCTMTTNYVPGTTSKGRPSTRETHT